MFVLVGENLYPLVSDIYPGTVGQVEENSRQLESHLKLMITEVHIEFSLFIPELCARWRRTAASWSPT